MDFEVQQRKFFIPVAIAFSAIIFALIALIFIFCPTEYWSILIFTFNFFLSIKYLVRKYGIKGKKQSRVIVWSLFLILIASSIGTKAYSADLHTSWRTPYGEETIAAEIENIRNWNAATLGTWEYAANDDIAIVTLQPKYAMFADEDMYVWLVFPHEPTDDGTTYKQIPFEGLGNFSRPSGFCVINYRGDRGQEIQVKFCNDTYYMNGTVITVTIDDYYDTGVVDELGNAYVSLFNEKSNLLTAVYWYDEGEKVPDTLTIGIGENKIKVSVQPGR